MTKTKITIAKQYLTMALFVVLVRLGFSLAFGDRSFESMMVALAAGAKLALWVIAFGALNLIFDFRKLLKRSPKFLSSFATALGITFSLTPELAKSLVRIRAASKLRSHRHGFAIVRSTTLPLLNDAVDQSINLADSMEARGFGGKPNTASGPIRLRNLTFGYIPNQLILNDVSLELLAGTLTLITGPTGCGKSTLLKVIQAKTPGVGFVSQFPRQSFVAETVFDELAFSLRQARFSELEIQARVSKLAQEFELPLKANPHELSAGWQQRLAIAAALSSGTKTLLLDEPFSALDPSATKLIVATLANLRNLGFTIVVAEHRTRPIAGLADLRLILQDGRLSPNQVGEPTLTQANYKTNVTALVGPNGSGKTTYLRRVASERGVLVPQPASDLLFLESVTAECKQADKDSGVKEGTTRELLTRIVPTINELQNPRDLSEGQKLGLAIAIQLSKPTDLLMLDEPTLGFDFESRQALVELISDIANQGTEVLVATHDEEFASAIASKVISIEEVGQLAAK
ncbi:MAG: hypothetical protein RLZZ06_487 [Actinomycetota bacterium]